MKRVLVLFVSLAAVAVAGLRAETPQVSKPAPAQYQPPALPIRMTAFAVNMSNIATGTTAIVEITVNQWSSNAERSTLIETMLSKGQDALLSALQKAPVKGRMRIPGWQGPDPHNVRLGWDLRYAYARPLDEGGTQIVLMADRYIGFWEARNQPRTIDYPFTIFQIHMPKEGVGKGTVAVATKISFDKKKNQVEIENYSTEPVRLNEIKFEKK